MSKLIMPGPSRFPIILPTPGAGFNLHRWRCRQLRWHRQLHVPRARAWEGPAGGGLLWRLELWAGTCQDMISNCKYIGNLGAEFGVDSISPR